MVVDFAVHQPDREDGGIPNPHLHVLCPIRPDEYKRQLIAYIIFEGPAEDRNMNTLVDMISGMEVKEDNENFMNAVDYMFKGLEKRKPDCFAVKQYKKYKLASGDICSK